MASKAAPSVHGGELPSEPGEGPGFTRPAEADSPVLAPLVPKVELDQDDDLTSEQLFGSNTSDRPSGGPIVRREGNALRGRVLVLNASFEPINVCTVRRAIVLILKEKAEVIDEHASAYGNCELHAEKVSFTRPSVIRLRSYVRIPYQSFRRKITRRAVFARDGWECQYCGRRGSLTMDHVVPRSKGGDTSWENVVACCAGCNRRKGDRSVSQSGMKLRTRPRAPQATIFIHVASPTIPVQWLPYVPASAAA
ncbi:MAG: HNH endonuclease [Solirubrobacterales bacterium]